MSGEKIGRATAREAEIVRSLRLAAEAHREQARDATGQLLTQAADAINDLLSTLETINRLTSPGSRTLDDFMRDNGLACDIARAAISKATGGEA